MLNQKKKKKKKTCTPGPPVTFPTTATLPNDVGDEGGLLWQESYIPTTSPRLRFATPQSP